MKGEKSVDCRLATRFSLRSWSKLAFVDWMRYRTGPNCVQDIQTNCPIKLNQGETVAAMHVHTGIICTLLSQGNILDKL